MIELTSVLLYILPNQVRCIELNQNVILLPATLVNKSERFSNPFRRFDGAADCLSTLCGRMQGLSEVSPGSPLDAPIIDRHRKRLDELHSYQRRRNVAG